ncbi:acyl-CoA synthetase [Alicyclobacillus contaminans]|uniref:fatty acyl-CoA synthetase n=1 Tax=Alicyclobacillus contaminans TaxID=392016 RepID=UPI0004178349|nr:fatty acyl-CoA synthetase [Alicyclobacillus contaminans]GMA49458.1 acyl-CoA synthetase [Alicyclobacillus contaminans]
MDLEAAKHVQRARRNTLGDLLTRTRARYPHKLALVYGTARWTYQQLDEAVNRTAHAFSAKGIGHGTPVAVLSRNSLDFAVIALALARLGAIFVPINYMLNEEEVAFIAGHSDVGAAAASEEFAPLMDSALAAVGKSDVPRYLMDSDAAAAVPAGWLSLDRERQSGSSAEFESAVSDGDVAQILYTSGTESRPKGVLLTHANLLAQFVSCIVDGRMEARDVAIHALPMYHSAQLNCFLWPGVYIGATGIILSHADPAEILSVVERERATQLFCPPTVWIALLRHPAFPERDLSSLEKCYYGAAIMPMEVLKELSERLPQARFWNFYGQTEVAPLATALQPEDQLHKLGSAGRPTLNVETKVVDDEGREVPPGTVGEIVHRTAHAMLGYLKEPEKTLEAFRDGWFHSGDLGVMDEEGYLTVVDRKKDMIKSGGENVSSREVEEVIYTFPGISEVAVVGVPDPYWMEAVTAVVVPKPGVTLDAEALKAHCRSRLAHFKVPKHVVVVHQLPKNPSGKVLKRDLREQYRNLV